MPSRIPERIRWAVAQMALRPADRVLEVGCGPGYAVALLCERLGTGSVAAIDRSALQVRRARERNRAHVEGGIARVLHCAISDAPVVLGRGTFEALLAVNVNVFWTAPATAVSAAAQLLAPQGLAYVVYEPPSSARLRALERSLPALFAEHGFRALEVRTTAFRTGHGLCLMGRPARGGQGRTT